MATSDSPAPELRLVQSYRPGGFTIAGTRHEGSLLILPDRVLPWAVSVLGDVDLASLDAVRLARSTVDILLVGTGAGFALFPPALRPPIREWGMVVDAMTTPAACRTYNILLAEGRAVAAALIALP